MSHVWGLDSAQPPDGKAAAALFAAGWSFIGGYIGPVQRCVRVWTGGEFQACAQAGLKLNAFYIAPLSGDPGYDAGVGEGNAALLAMQARGLSGWLQIDVESGAAPREWFSGFMAAIHAGQCSGQLYGSRASLAALGDLADSWYLAYYASPNVTEPKPQPDWDQWQYSTGPAYNYNVAVETFPFTAIAL